MSPREQTQQDLISWISETGRFNAPYGILESVSDDKKYRSVTFGIARITDIEVRIYSAKWLWINDVRHGATKVGSLDDLKALLTEWWHL